MATRSIPYEFSCACHGIPRSRLLPESLNRGNQILVQHSKATFVFGRVETFVESSTCSTIQHLPAGLIAIQAAQREQAECIFNAVCTYLTWHQFAPTYIHSLSLLYTHIDSCSQEKPVVASGTFVRGGWETVTGREKIESVRIELDERAVRGSLASVDPNVGEPWISA